jgi:hypothetical protein
MVAEVSELKLPEVMAVDEMDRLAVTVPLIAMAVPLVTPCTERTSIEGLPAVPTSA